MAKLVPVLGIGLSRCAEAIERAEAAFHTLGAGGDESVKAKLACDLAWAHNNSGSSERALQWSETALLLGEQFDDIELLARTTGAKSSALFNLGRHREAVILARGEVALAEAAGSLVQQAAGWMGLSLFICDDDPRESLSAAFEAAELARRAGHRGLEIVNLLNAAETSLYLGEWGDTRAAIADLEQRDLPLEQRAHLSCTEGLLVALTGNAKQASTCLELRADRLAATEMVTARATYLMDRSLVSLAAGDLERARQESAAAVSADPMGINSPYVLAIQTRACLWLGDVDGARTAQSAMTGFRGRWMAAERLTAEAGLAALEGRVEKAAKSYREAIEAWRALECTLDLALCELDLVLLLGPDHPDATAAKEARDIFTQLGATPFLERLNRAAGTER